MTLTVRDREAWKFDVLYEGQKLSRCVAASEDAGEAVVIVPDAGAPLDDTPSPEGRHSDYVLDSVSPGAWYAGAMVHGFVYRVLSGDVKMVRRVG